MKDHDLKKIGGEKDNHFSKKRNAAQAEGLATALISPLVCRLPNANLKSLGKFLHGNINTNTTHL